MPNLASIDHCTGCLVCVDVCPHDALSAKYNDEGHLSYVVDKGKCVNCGLCEKKCTIMSSFKYGCNNLKLSIPYAAWCKDDGLRKNSTSGGVFSALAYYIISKGGYAVGASMNRNVVQHIIIDKVEDIIKIQGSKYTQSNTFGIYKKIRSLLFGGKTVLFSGTGCQVAGLLSFLGDKAYSGILITVDVICGGVPSRLLIDRFLNYNTSVKEIVGYRNKSKYELSVINTDGERIVIPKSERPLPLCGFYVELTHRYSCYDCQFNGAHRRCDITIGDYWGDQEFIEQHNNGISVAVAHSKKGVELLKKADLEIHEIGWDNFIMHNPRLIDGYKNKARLKARKDLANSFRDYSYEKLLQVYANKATWHEPIVLIKKIARHLKELLHSKIYQIRLKKMIKELYCL